MSDQAFSMNPAGLARACQWLTKDQEAGSIDDLPAALPDTGLGENATLDRLAPLVLGAAARLDGRTAFAHMDPPTPWITWAMNLWTASLNQNLLHPATAPMARPIEERVIDWLLPYFGMNGGHLVPGATLANLTGLWAARQCAGVEEVWAGAGSHISVAKSAHLLGLRYVELASDAGGVIRPDELPAQGARAALVLTAGTTSAGLVDRLDLAGRAAWTHVDAAWAGPLRLSERHSSLLDGIDRADSVAISAHKWLFQPKESALVLFRDAERANRAISFSGAYLATPNIGVLGSHGAAAVPLLATLLAWGRRGVAARIEACMAMAQELALAIEQENSLELFAPPRTGIVLWRPRLIGRMDAAYSALPEGSTSRTSLAGAGWFRNVAANPTADMAELTAAIKRVAAA